MLTIRPVSELSKNMAEIERLVIDENETIALSKNSKEHMVLMSHNQFKKLSHKVNSLEDKAAEDTAKIEELTAKIAIYEGIIRSQGQIRRGEALPWQAAKEQSDARFKERLDAVYSDRDPGSPAQSR